MFKTAQCLTESRSQRVPADLYWGWSSRSVKLTIHLPLFPTVGQTPLRFHSFTFSVVPRVAIATLSYLSHLLVCNTELGVQLRNNCADRDTPGAGNYYHRPLFRATCPSHGTDLKAGVQIAARGLGTSNLLRAIHFIRSIKWDVFWATGKQ